MGEDGGLALGGEADVASPAALPEAPVGGGDADLPSTLLGTGPSTLLDTSITLGISTLAAFGRRQFAKRFLPGRFERRITAALAVKAHQAEAGIGGRVLAPGAAA